MECLTEISPKALQHKFFILVMAVYQLVISSRPLREVCLWGNNWPRHPESCPFSYCDVFARGQYIF